MSKRREGYLLIDNRNSPGVSLDMIRASGKDVPFAAPGIQYESATVTCSHCNAVVVLNPARTRPRGYCPKCNGYVCDTPQCGLECRSFEKLIDELQNDAVNALAPQFTPLVLRGT